VFKLEHPLVKVSISNEITGVGKIAYLVSTLKAPFKVTFQCHKEACCVTNIRKLFLFNQIMIKYDLHDIGIKRNIFFWIVFVSDINRDFIVAQQKEMDNRIVVQVKRLDTYANLHNRMVKVQRQFNKNIEEIDNYDKRNHDNPLVLFNPMYEMDCMYYYRLYAYEQGLMTMMRREKKAFNDANIGFTENHIKAFNIPYNPLNEVDLPTLTDFHLYCLVENHFKDKLTKLGVKANESCLPYLRYDKTDCAFKLYRPPTENDITQGKKTKDLYDGLVTQYRSCFPGTDITKHKYTFLPEIQSLLLHESYILQVCDMRLLPYYVYTLYIDDGQGSFYAIVEQRDTTLFAYRPAYTIIVNKSITEGVDFDNVLSILYDLGLPLHTHMFCSYCKETVYTCARLDNSIEDVKKRKIPERMTFKCGKCREVYYCGKTCQTSDWRKSHKTTCVTMPLPQPNIVVK
jgi:hypothetical protein